jgi:hypothetical protein
MPSSRSGSNSIAEMLEQQKAGAPARGKRKTTEELLQMVERDQENGASIVKQIRERRPGRPIQPPAHPPEDILNPLVPRAAHADRLRRVAHSRERRHELRAGELSIRHHWVSPVSIP